MQLIDFHTHVYPDAIAHKASQSVRDFYGIGDAYYDGTVSDLLQSMEATGTQRCVILPVGMKPETVRRVNEFAAEKMRRHPEFTSFSTVHAAMEHIEEEVEHIQELGLRGIKLHPDSQMFPADDARLFPMYDRIQGKLPVMIHMGDHRHHYSHPERLRRIADAFPRLQIIAAHFGGYSTYQMSCQLLKDTQCVLDISSSLMFMPEGDPEKYIRTYGAERILYGSDFPFWDPAVELQRFLKLKLTDDEFEQIASKTALRILGEG